MTTMTNTEKELQAAQADWAITDAHEYVRRDFAAHGYLRFRMLPGGHIPGTMTDAEIDALVAWVADRRGPQGVEAVVEDEDRTWAPSLPDLLTIMVRARDEQAAVERD